jgi:hypothetical protein
MIMNKFLVSKKNILSEVAHWAVAQSPYHRPDNLEIVLDKLNILLGEWKENLGYREMTYPDIKEYLKDLLYQIPEFMLWNERKNGNKSAFQFVIRYSKDIDPDNDFIDLDALIRNVSNSIIRKVTEIPIPILLGESMVEEQTDEKSI